MMKALMWCCAAAVAIGLPAEAATGIVYTCDANLNTLAPQACGVLNTTIAALYSAAFTNANATIYVKLGSTILGESRSWANLFPYSDFRNHLMAAAGDANDALAISASVPATNPFGGGMMQVTTALQRALGYSPTTGVTPNLASCNLLSSPGCYDGVITISNSASLYFRTGPITSRQFDFYSVVEHETDEVLGASSCAFGCSTSYHDAADLFRYHSNGTRATGSGTNAPCSSPSSTNACFSLDGVHMLQQYNNVTNGLDAGDWNGNCQAQLVQDADRCPGTAGVDINFNAEILVLDVVGYTLRARPAPPGPFACTNTAPPSIASATSSSGYGGYSHFSGGTWLEINGSNLADPGDPRLASGGGEWAMSDFKGANAPTVLDGVSVSVNGKPAYVGYLSPGQLIVQAPADSATGDVAITVTNCQGTSPAYPLSRQAAAPGLLAPSSYTAHGTPYLMATFAADGAYVLDSALGASFGLNSRPARPGDLIVVYGIGFGDVSPAIGPGVIAGQSNALVNPAAFSFGTAPATVIYGGLAPNLVGIYEFIIIVPANLANGDYPIHVSQNGAALPQLLYLTVQN